MVKKEVVAFGLLVGMLLIPNVFADNIIGSYKVDPKSVETKSGPQNVIQNASEINGSSSDKKDIKPVNSTVDTTQPETSTNNSGTSDTKSNGVIEGTPTKSSSGGTTGSGEETQLKKDIKNILSNNPEIIVEALQKYTESQEKAQQAKLEASLIKYQGDISRDTNAAVLGKKDAEVKLVVFLDPNCPHCRPFTQALNKVRENFPNVAVLVRHWPILGKDSEDVVRGLWAIKQQGQDLYISALNAIATSEERYTSEKLLAWVKDHKLNVAKFQQDSTSEPSQTAVEETSKLAKNIGLQGTPTSLLIDKKGVHLVMPNDEKSLKNILEEASKA